MLVSTEVFRAAQWHDFFVMVGTGAAALTGLVFVAMSLNVAVIAQDPTHRYRAFGNLTGLTASFMLCGLVLMGGQNHVAVGAEILAVSGIAGAFLISGYFRALRSPGGERGVSSTFRMIGGSTCYLLEAVGAIVLMAGVSSGLYLAAGGIVANFSFMISGAWLLVVGVRSESPTS